MKKLYLIGCGITILMFTGCAYNDHSRNFYQDVCSEDNGWVEVTNEVLLEKRDTAETSKADNAQDIKPSLTIPASVL